MRYALSVLIGAGFLSMGSLDTIAQTAPNKKEIIPQTAQELVESCKSWGDEVDSGVAYCLDKEGFMPFIYDDLYRTEKYGGPQVDRAENYMKLHALRYEDDYTLLRIEAMKLYGMEDDDPLITGLLEAMAWADELKAKSAEDLYMMSQKDVTDPSIRADFKKRVQKEFLALAVKKGYVVPEKDKQPAKSSKSAKSDK